MIYGDYNVRKNIPYLNILDIITSKYYNVNRKLYILQYIR